MLASLARGDTPSRAEPTWLARGNMATKWAVFSARSSSACDTVSEGQSGAYLGLFRCFPEFLQRLRPKSQQWPRGLRGSLIHALLARRLPRTKPRKAPNEITGIQRRALSASRGRERAAGVNTGRLTVWASGRNEDSLFPNNNAAAQAAAADVTTHNVTTEGPVASVFLISLFKKI